MYRLHCFAQSGNCYKVALMLALSGVAWEPVFVDFFNGETRGERYRSEVNELGEAPVLEADGKRMSQSGVILDFLARETGKFAPRDEAERAECWRWILFDNHKFTGYVSVYRFLRTFMKDTDPAVLDFLKARAERAFAIADKHFASQAFLLGANPTIADISMAGYVFFPVAETGFDFGPADMARYLGEFARGGLINIAGGCCGNTPEHIAAIAKAVEGLPPRPFGATNAVSSYAAGAREERELAR